MASLVKKHGGPDKVKIQEDDDYQSWFTASDYRNMFKGCYEIDENIVKGFAGIEHNDIFKPWFDIFKP